MHAACARNAAIALGLVYCPTVVAADASHERGGTEICARMAWPIERERRWFASDALPRRASGARLKRIDRAVMLALEPQSRVKLFLPPEVRATPNSYSGEVTFFGVPAFGEYQITLSSPAAVDVFENGVRLKATELTSGRGCPGVYESMRFELAPGDLVLVQITNAASKSIKVALARAEPDSEEVW